MATSNSAPPRPVTNFSRAKFALDSDCERVCRERLRPDDRSVLRRIRTISCLRGRNPQIEGGYRLNRYSSNRMFCGASRESQLPIVPHRGRGSRAILLAVKLSSFCVPAVFREPIQNLMRRYVRRHVHSAAKPWILPRWLPRLDSNQEEEYSKSTQMRSPQLGGGWGGIRTPGAFRHTRFPGVHNQPLCHPSKIIFRFL